MRGGSLSFHSVPYSTVRVLGVRRRRSCLVWGSLAAAAPDTRAGERRRHGFLARCTRSAPSSFEILAFPLTWGRSRDLAGRGTKEELEKAPPASMVRKVGGGAGAAAAADPTLAPAGSPVGCFKLGDPLKAREGGGGCVFFYLDAKEGSESNRRSLNCAIPC